MVAEPAALVVERDDEEVRRSSRSSIERRVVALEHRVAERRRTCGRGSASRAGTRACSARARPSCSAPQVVASRSGRRRRTTPGTYACAAVERERGEVQARRPSPPHGRSAPRPALAVHVRPGRGRGARTPPRRSARAPARPSSSSSPSARSFARPSRASVRPESTSCEPRGTWARSAARASRQSWFSSSCTSSSTSTSGSLRAASAAPRRGSPRAHSESAGALSALKTAGSIVAVVVQRLGDVRQEDDGIVVAVVERDPGELALVVSPPTARAPSSCRSRAVRRR